MSVFVDVEIILREYSNNISKKAIIAVVHRYLQKIIVRPNSVINNFENSVLHKDVKTIIVGDIPTYNNSFVDFGSVEVNWFVYNLDDYGPIMQCESDGDEGEIIISTQLSLPSACLVNLWENLYYDHNIKQNVSYIDQNYF
nr:uncharacterized protein LOC111516851 [Leptinotarsa decemlineata]